MHGPLDSIEIRPIGYLVTPFPEKFGLPRQAGLVSCFPSTLVLVAPYNNRDALCGLEVVSHLWITYLLHRQPKDWKPKVRPPRLGGNTKLGVFATRSPHRPNRLGLSAVRLDQVDFDRGRLELSGGDFLHGTPVLDIKPYLPYTDRIEDAVNEIAPRPPEKKRVVLAEGVEASLLEHGIRLGQNLLQLCLELFQFDHRPSYQKDQRTYGTSLYDLEVNWCYQEPDEVVLHSVELSGERFGATS